MDYAGRAASSPAVTSTSLPDAMCSSATMLGSLTTPTPASAACRSCAMSSVTRRGLCVTRTDAPSGPSSSQTCSQAPARDRGSAAPRGRPAPAAASCSLTRVGTGDDVLRTLAKRAHDEVGRLERREADAQRHVDSFTDDVDTAGCQFQLHGHAGVGRHIARNHRADLEADEGWRRADPEQALRSRARAFDRFLGGARLDQHGDAVAIEFLADLGDCQLPCGTLQQPHAEALLQRDDAAAELRLRQAEGPAGWPRSRRGRPPARNNRGR